MNDKVFFWRNPAEIRAGVGAAESKVLDSPLRALRGFLEGNRLLLAHGGDDSDNILLGILELIVLFQGLLDLFPDLTIRIELHIIFLGCAEKVEEVIVGNTQKLVFSAGHVRHVHVVGGRTNIFEFFSGKDIDGDEMDFSMSMFTRLGGGHVNDFAGPALDHDVTVLPESRALHGVGERGT